MTGVCRADGHPQRRPSRPAGALVARVGAVRCRAGLQHAGSGARITQVATIFEDAWRYRLTVRTEPSQGLNTGSIPVSATNSF